MHITPLSITIVKITNKHLEIKQGAEKVHWNLLITILKKWPSTTYKTLVVEF